MRSALMVVALVILMAVASCSGKLGPSQDVVGPNPAETAPATADDGKKLFEERCSACHKLSRPEGYGGTDPWQSSVGRMIDTHGAKIVPEDAAKIVAYLDRAHPLKK